MHNMAQRPEAARTNMPQRLETARIKRYRRFHGYDYSRGASIFVTFALKERLPLFGRVEGDKVVLSPAGRAALEAILFENRRPGRRVWAASYVVMPDHIHIRLVLEPGSGEEPLRHVGQFVNNVKRWSRKHAAEIGVEVEWEPNYHDHICVSRMQPRHIALRRLARHERRNGRDGRGLRRRPWRLHPPKRRPRRCTRLGEKVSIPFFGELAFPPI